jgi:hypothetical protein
MLWLTRTVYRDCGDRNCVVFDLPDGRRVRLWIVPSDRQERGAVRVGIDAPRDVAIVRGELLPPLDTQPDPPKGTDE